MLKFWKLRKGLAAELSSQGYAATLGEEPVVHRKLKPDYQIAIDRIQGLFGPGDKN